MGRRRHSAGEFGEYSQAGPSMLHPYAAAAQSSQDIQQVSGRMQGMRVGTLPIGPAHAGPSRGAHMRAPSQPAPDYDTHSFANMPPPSPPPVPPLPPLRSPPSNNALRSPASSAPARRVLAVVNADADAQAGSRERLGPPERDMRLRGRVSYVESVYDPPPPAYDAIDFSVPPMRSLATVPSMPSLQSAPLPPAPLPVPPMQNGEGQRGS